MSLGILRLSLSFLLSLSVAKASEPVFRFVCPERSPNGESFLGARFNAPHLECTYGVGEVVEVSDTRHKHYACSFPARPQRGKGIGQVSACLGTAQDCVLRCQDFQYGRKILP